MFEGKGRVLVMDDEEVICLVIDNMLQRLGYEILLTSTGEEAIKEYKKALGSGRPFDAVILDLTVRGGMGGAECISHLLGIDPSVKALVSSGYSEDLIMSDYRKLGFRNILAKPYQIEELGSVVASVISEP